MLLSLMLPVHECGWLVLNYDSVVCCPTYFVVYGVNYLLVRLSFRSNYHTTAGERHSARPHNTLVTTVLLFLVPR